MKSIAFKKGMNLLVNKKIELESYYGINSGPRTERCKKGDILTIGQIRESQEDVQLVSEKFTFIPRVNFGDFMQMFIKKELVILIEVT